MYNFKDYDVLVLGETFIEFSCDEDIVRSDCYHKDIGGADVYTAVSAARQGASVAMISAVAVDPFHSLIRDRLLKEGVNIDNVINCEGYNGIYFMSSRNPNHREYLFHRPGSASEQITPSVVHSSILDNTKIIYASSELQSISKKTRHAVFKAFHHAHINDIMVAYDPNLRLNRWSMDDAKEALWSVLPLIDVILPSAPEETKALFGYERPLDVIGFLWDRGVDIVVVKNGVHGCMVGYAGKIEEISVPATPNPVQYKGLIGSVFNGAFLQRVAMGYDPFVAAEFAVKVTSMKGMVGNGIASIPGNDLYNQKKSDTTESSQNERSDEGADEESK